MASDTQLDNPDQRISEDVNTFTGRSLHFLLIILGALMQLVAFSAVLWSISKPLMGILVAYAAVGTALSLWLFGEPLVRLNKKQLKQEADFRYGLMQVRDNAESIAFYGGEKQERANLNRRFKLVFKNYAALIKTQRNLNLLQRGFGQLSLVIPSVVLAHSVLSGSMEVGVAVQAGGAFLAVLAALSLVMDNFETLSRFGAGVDRLYALSSAIFPNHPADSAQRNIIRRVSQGLKLKRLTVRTPDHLRVLVSNLNLHLKPGDALLITGESGCGKSSLLRAIAGLWQAGQGSIDFPAQRDVLFLPQKPYLQMGTLRSQLIYPQTQSPHGDERLMEILHEVGLNDLASRCGGLDAVQDWGKLLSGGEQQRIAFARLLVHQPRFAVLDEATSALDEENQARLYQRLREKGTTFISIAHREAVARFHDHVLKLKGAGRWTLERIRAGSR